MKSSYNSITAGPGPSIFRRPAVTMRAMRTMGRSWWPVATVMAITVSLASPPALGATGTRGTSGFSLRPTYRADDFADGQAMSILPAGENGLVNEAAVQAVHQDRPAPAA